MARRAVLRRGLVEQNSLSRDDASLFVTVAAFDVLVSAAEWEGSALLVVE